MISIRLRVRLAKLALCAVAALAPDWVQSETKVANTGRCSAILVKSTTRSVTVNCGYNSRQISTLISSINRLLAKGNISDPATDQIIEALNAFIADGLSRQEDIISRTDVIEQKLDKLVDLVNSFQTRPDELGPALAQISANAISYTRISGPLSLQIVGAYRISYGTQKGIRFIFRLGLTGSIQPEFVVAEKKYYSSMAEKWLAIGDKGTACSFDVSSAGMTIPTSSDPNMISAGRSDITLAANELPLTIVTNSVCPDFVEGDPLDVRVRLHYRMPQSVLPNAPRPASQIADFRFGGVVPSFY